jgi:hypothetical protein
MTLQIVTAEVAVHRKLRDDDGNPIIRDGAEQREETVFYRGQLVPEDWVDSHQMFVLTSTGMAKVVEEPDPALRAAQERPAPVLLPEHSPQFVEGTSVTRAPELVTARTSAATLDDDSLAVPRPADDEQDKAVWEDYAARSLGLNRAQVESLGMTDLKQKITEAEQRRETDRDQLVAEEEAGQAVRDARTGRQPSGEGQPGEQTDATRPADQPADQADSGGRGGKGGEKDAGDKADEALPRAYNRPTGKAAERGKNK